MWQARLGEEAQTLAQTSVQLKRGNSIQPVNYMRGYLNQIPRVQLGYRPCLPSAFGYRRQPITLGPVYLAPSTIIAHHSIRP